MHLRHAAMVAALVVAAGVVTSDGTAPPASAESPASKPVPVGLHGIYRVEVYGSRGTFDGRPFVTGDTERRYAITSTCAARCTARGVPSTGGGVAQADLEWTFDGARWVSEGLADASPCLADPARDVPLTVGWQLEPQSDGTLTGTRTLTEVIGGTAPCAGSGGVYATPVRLTPGA